MVTEKRPLSMEQIEAQTALELPERATPALVTVTCLAVCIGSIQVTVQNIRIAAAVCAAVQAIAVLTGAQLSCTVSA